MDIAVLDRRDVKFDDAVVDQDGCTRRDFVCEFSVRDRNSPRIAETVFLGPPETPAGTVRVRIFTPQTEVPFAGHPTVGTACFLAETGVIDVPPSGTRAVLEENVGPIDVT